MAGSFGGVIKLGGVFEYQNALKTVSQSLRETGSELKLISSEFAASDQKEKAQMKTLQQLTDVLNKQKAAYENLKKTYAVMSSTYETNRAKLSLLNVQYVAEKAKLNEIGKTLGTTSTKYKEQEKVVANLKKEVANATKVQETNQTDLSKTRTKLNEAKQAYTDTATKVKNFSKSVEDSGNTAAKVAQKGYTTLKNTIANVLSDAFKRLTGMISGQFSAAIDRVDTIKAFGTTLKNLGYTEDNVTQVTKDLVDGIEGLPTSLPGIMQIQKQFLALTGELKKSTDLTLALNDATLAGGQGQEIANSAMTQWYQIIANGKPDLQSWRIIQQAMPAQLNQIAESLMGAGKKSEDLYKAWQDGNITTEQVIDTLIRLDKEGSESVSSFEDQAKGSSQGIKTSWENIQLAITKGLSDLIDEIGSENITGFLDNLKTVIRNVFNVVKDAFKYLLDHGQEIANILIILAATFGPLLVIEKVGSAINNFNKALEGFGKLKGIGDAVGKIGKKVFDLGSNLTKFLAPAIDVVKGAFVKLGAVMMAHPAVLVVAAIAALVAIFIVLWNKCEGFRNFFIGLWENIKKATMTAVDAIGKFFGDLWNNIQKAMAPVGDFFKGIWDGIVGVFSGAASWFGDVFSAAWNGIQQAFSWAVNFFSNIWNGITGIFSHVAGWFGNVFSSAWNGITRAFSGVGNFFSGVWDGITRVFQNIGGWFGNIFSSAWDGITRAFSNVWNFFSDVFKNICKPFEGIANFFGDLGGKIWDKVVSIGSNIIKGIWDGITGAIDWIKGKFGEWGGKIIGFVEKIFGINSPSKVFRDKIGKPLAEGIGVGFTDEMDSVTAEMKDSLPRDFDVSAHSLRDSQNTSENGYRIDYVATVNAFKEALSGMTVEMDDENMGRFIRKTVSKAIYA